MPAGFAGALREWRKRRRMSQLELAVRAGTTQRHLSFVESNRSLPGRSMVVRLAEALDLPLRERNALLRAAGFAPVYEERPLDDPELGAIRAALERIVEGHEPYPATIINRQGDLVSANPAFWRLIDGAAPELLEPPVNIARVLVHPRGLASRIVNLPEWGWHVVEALSREATSYPSTQLDALIHELETMLPTKPTPGPDYIGFSTPLRLRSEAGELELVTTLTHFGTAVDVTIAELRLEAFLPANQATASYLGASAGRAARPQRAEI